MSKSESKPSEAVKTSEGRQHHIDLAPGELAGYILLCVDPARMTCGYDNGLPVIYDYETPFRFTGKIKRVVVIPFGEEGVDQQKSLTEQGRKSNLRTSSNDFPWRRPPHLPSKSRAALGDR